MTEMDRMIQEIKEVEESQDLDKAMGLVKYLAWKVVESNANNRAVERAVAQVCGTDKFTQIISVAMDERLIGDRFTEKEQKFYEEMFTIWD